MPYRSLFGEHFVVCAICGAYVSKPKKHKRWHRVLEKQEKRMKSDG